MLSNGLADRLDQLFRTFASEHREVRDSFSKSSSAPAVINAHATLLARLCGKQVRRVLDMVSDLAGGSSEVRSALLRNGELVDLLCASQIFERSIRARSRLTLQALLFGVEARAATPSLSYGEALDQALLQMPTVQAHYKAIEGLRQRLLAVPQQHWVLAVSCNSAPELRSIVESRRLPFRLRMLDACAGTLASNHRALGDAEAEFGFASPVELIEGRTCFQRVGPNGECTSKMLNLETARYSLIYSPDIMSGLRLVPGDFARGAAGLTRQLSKLLIRGGRLLLGAPMAPASAGGIGSMDRFIIDTALGCRHLTRTAQEILSFADSIPHDIFQIRLLDGSLHGQLRPSSSFAWIEIERVA
jgi:hypothetical protein